MIRYSIPSTAIEKLIRNESPKWIEKAAAETGKHRKAKVYSAGKVNWSDVKQAFITAQKGKCV